jgi:chromosome segregation ATPase
MQTGRQTLAGIEEALGDIKAQEASLARELEGTNRERVGLVAERLEALRRLAAIRARDAMADGVIDEADNLTHQVRGILEARLTTITSLEDRQRKAEAARAAHIARQDEQTRRIADLEERLDRFGAEAREELQRDARYRELTDSHAALSATLDKALEKADQVTRDEHEKGLPYRSDPLFMYLWGRKWGTSGYQAGGLVSMLDGWVAGLVRYPDARANYALLTEIPVRLRAHAEDVRKHVQEVKTAIDELEAQRTRDLAGADLIAELKRERERQTELNQQLEKITSELSEAGGQLKIYAKGEDQSFIAAVAAYASFLEREPLRRLMGDAAATETKEDDQVVEKVRDIAASLDKIEAANVSRRRRLDQLSERKLELQRLASNFRRQRYDDVGSEFGDNPRVEDLLQMLLRGAITAAEYWVRMQQQQSWRHRPADPWRRQSGLPPFDGFPGGPGGWMGGSWGGGGNRGGGGRPSGGSGRDFETGGSF